MSQLYCTGPAHVLVAFGGSNPRYLGTAKISPQIELKPEYKPVFNDLGGDVPLDVSYLGEEALSQIDFTRWDESVYEIIAARPRSNAAATIGANTSLDVGTLVLTEGFGFIMYVLFPFATAKAAYSTLPAGYRFPASVFVGPDKMEQMGTHNMERLMVFRHLRIFNATTGAFLLYDGNVTATRGIPLG